MKKLNKIYVEITSVCNLACSFCPPTERKSSYISVEQFASTLDQIKPHTDHIYLHVKGEPLLHPKLDELLDISHAKGFKVNITTNGTLINKMKNKLLGKPALRQMNFSLHSFDGHEGSKDKEGYVSSVLAFVKEIVQQPGVYISLRLWNLTEDNVTNVQRMRNQTIVEMIEQAFGLDFRIEEKFVRGGGIRLAERVYLNYDHEFEWPALDEEEDDGRGFCHALRNHAAVLVDGTVVPCCLDGEGVIKLGNLHQASFADIVDGERATRIYDGFSRREVVEELCRKCGYRRRFDVPAQQLAVDVPV